jgi:hypothetical protein
MDLPAPLKNPAVTAELLNAKLAPGLTITKIELHSGHVPQKIRTTYTLTLPTDISDPEKIRVGEFIDSAHFLIGKTRKGKTIEIDIRPLIEDLTITTAGAVQLQMVTASAQPGIKPLEALTGILGLDEERSMQTRIVKTDWKNLDETA